MTTIPLTQERIDQLPVFEYGTEAHQAHLKAIRYDGVFVDTPNPWWIVRQGLHLEHTTLCLAIAGKTTAAMWDL